MQLLLFSILIAEDDDEINELNKSTSSIQISGNVANEKEENSNGSHTHSQTLGM